MDFSENARRKKKRDQDVKNKIKNMSKEALAAAMLRKKECNARAMHIVEQSIEPDVKELWLLDNLKHINQSHFQDIVEERAITRICGYPLCVEELTNVPKKMYKISTRENKVYDITDRKNYCSNNCYKAGTYLKDQLYTSPLWLRDCEVPVDYKILASSKAGKDTGAGTEIDLGNTKPVKLEKPRINEIDLDKSRADFLQNKEGFLKHKPASLTEFIQVDSCKNDSTTVHLTECKKFEVVEISKLDHSEDVTLNKSNKEKEELENKNSNLNLNKSFIEKDELESKNSNLKICSDNEVQETNKTSDQIKNVRIKKTRKPKECPKEPNSLSIINDIEQRIESWFTFETMLYLLGQEKVRELLKMSGYSEDISPKKNDETFYLKCQELFKKLNILELKDKEKQKPSKPVPDYEALRKETKELEIKVKSFYRGDAKVTFQDEDEMLIKSSDSESEDNPVLPLIDHCSIMLSRRRIFIERLNKVLPDMLSALELSHFRIGGEVQELVSTFKLSPTNICMRPPEWTLVAVIIIKLLTLHNDILNFAYSRELTQKRLITYLLTYDLDGGYPERFTTYLMDIERIASMIDISK